MNKLLKEEKKFKKYNLRQIQKIIDDESQGTNCEKYLAALTAGDRVPWAQTREKYFSKGLNKSSLSIIEKVIYIFKNEFQPLKKSHK